MKKRVLIIHGWDGNPRNNWFPWLKKELEKNNFEVIIPAMPNPEKPEINSWVNTIKNKIKEPDENTFLIGHSMGCQTIMRYLESMSNNSKVGGVILVAGFFNLQNLDAEEKPIAKPWLETKIDLNKVKSHYKNFIAIFSDDDKFVPLSDSKIFKEKLNAKIIIEHNKGHFDDDAKTKELPIVLKELLRISTI